MLDKLYIVKLEHMPSSANKMADTFTSLAATFTLGVEEDMTIPICRCWVVLPNNEDSEEDTNVIYVLKIDEEY